MVCSRAPPRMLGHLRIKIAKYIGWLRANIRLRWHDTFRTYLLRMLAVFVL